MKCFNQLVFVLFLSRIIIVHFYLLIINFIDMKDAFINAMQQGYQHKGLAFKIGVAKYNNEPIAACDISIPLKMMNRHGLIAGATGTGKTKTLQMIAEGLSANGVPVMLMDIKGDLSGMAAPGKLNGFIEERYAIMGESYKPTAFPVELLTISNEKGARMRATVTEFGPVLFSKILDLNDTQSGILAVLFKYCDDHGLALLDLKDLVKVLQYAAEEGKAELERAYGKISTVSLSTIQRKVIELQQQGGDVFFGELSFDPMDLMKTNAQGMGYINILRLVDLQDRPKLFSAFMLQLLAEIYAIMPEAGDMDKPKLVIFIDEAHLIFNEASKTLLNQIETIIKLIRSKGVGIFFCTQNPQDVPNVVLGQLGLKVQHALRAFTAKDRKDIKLTAENYPLSDFYKADEIITQMGTGEAMVTMLNEKGAPTPLAHVYLMSPRSRMDVLTDMEIQNLTMSSVLVQKYNQTIDRESAYEILSKRLDKIQEQAPPVKTTKVGRPTKPEPSILEKALNSAAGKQVQRSLVRTIFGMVTKMFK
jgi:DNA helicase HerA-like ATPase